MAGWAILTYSVRLTSSCETRAAPEIRVLVRPRLHVLALAGFRPNPAKSVDLAISFRLPDAAPGRLELIDVTGPPGRRARSLGLGPQVLARFRPGIQSSDSTV